MKFENVICPFCGCLCDDIEITVEQGKIKESKKGCFLSKSLFSNYNKDLASPTIDGKGVTIDQAIDRASSILAGATYPVVYGLASTTCEAQREAIKLAEIIGANIDSTASTCHGSSTIAFHTEGMVSCTLGEVQNRADLIIYWGSNPAEAHPRHFARYSIMPKGLYTPKGRKDRKVIIVDVRKTKSALMADIFLQIEPGRDFECLLVLRALINGRQIDSRDIGGISIEDLKSMADMMRACKYGMLFFGMGLAQSRGRAHNVGAAFSLVRDLNQVTRFAIMPMRGHYNVVGAAETLSWTTGFPFAVNFSRGYPRYNPGEFSITDLLGRKEVDAALILASDPVANLPEGAARHLSKIPTIVLDPKKSMTSRIAEVVIPTAISGISAGGTAYRMDCVPLALKKIVESPFPSDKDVIESIIKRVEELKGTIHAKDH